MPVTILKEWDFNTLDYSKFIHLSNKKKVTDFALKHGFCSRLGVDGTNPYLRPFSITSKKMVLKGVKVFCILYAKIEKDKEACYCMYIFPDKEKFIKHFMKQFEFIVDVQRKRRKQMRTIQFNVNK
ncbi:MAG: hypothetical protein K9J25_04020 [Bacteroidales bacterium]|nr:hypothetical protein [Bacteroidales bacterium]